jgi:hypothetical protein
MTEEVEKRKIPPKIMVRDYIDAKQLKIDMSFSPSDLTAAMMTQASLFAHYGVQLSKASRQVDDIKMLLEINEAKVYRALRDKAAADGVKMTEAQLEKMVQTESRIIVIKKALNEARQIEANAKTAVEAFRHRRDMLVQQGFISVQELKGEVSISRRNAVESEIEAAKKRWIGKTEQ